MNPSEFVEQADRDGFFLVRDFFSPGEVHRTRDELLQILDRDLERRDAVDAPPRLTQDGRVVSALTPLMHTVYFPLWESEGLRDMARRLLDDELIAEATRRVVGECYRLRVDLVRRASGADDRVDGVQLPHEWHRDTPGEFTFGIFFDDLTRPDSGGTAVVPGTHWFAEHPLWDLALSPNSRLSKERYLRREPDGPSRLDPRLYRFMMGNRLLRRRVGRRTVEIRGRPGDVYFFVNDLWHGRAPNAHGAQNVMVRIGGFASEFEFKDDLGLPAAGLDVLPETLARRYRRDQPINTDPTTVLRRIQHRRRSLAAALAAREKRLATRIIDKRATRRVDRAGQDPPY